ncbi:phosphate acyltransferase PlsX [Rubrobacter aplysinae]|uniref:phosphate acyltransferase PlsX n=1 Tax=Rubrobacter aplysinae TaxID=909625 RepID=UPI00064B9360|nr:phosphate acyltransferase PlsX [Rubrobacter aplysinae]
MRIAVDALGGDGAPGEIVSGAVSAASRLGEDEIVLVGDEPGIQAALGDSPMPDNVSIRAASGRIEMADDPAAALRSNPESSISVAAKMIRDGEAEALFSAGSTGATVGASLLIVGRLESCRRPAIATVIPFPDPVLLVDAGATISCRARDLLNFAILGSVFADRYREESAGPVRTGLVNVGEEPGKGNELAKEAYGLLADCGEIEFVGNVEGREIGRGVADVLVTDGFTGNVVLKTAEGVSSEILGMVRSEMTGGPLQKLAAAVLKPRLGKIKYRVDPENYGGSFLLGVEGTVVIGHGNSRARGVENALLGISRAGSGLPESLEAALRRGEVPSGVTGDGAGEL